MEVKTKPLTPFRVRLAFEGYSVGTWLYPTGLWRDHLLSRGYIERVPEESETVAEPTVEEIVERSEPEMLPAEQQRGRKRRGN